MNEGLSFLPATEQSQVNQFTLFFKITFRQRIYYRSIAVIIFRETNFSFCVIEAFSVYQKNLNENWDKDIQT